MLDVLFADAAAWKVCKRNPVACCPGCTILRHLTHFISLAHLSEREVDVEVCPRGHDVELGGVDVDALQQKAGQAGQAGRAKCMEQRLCSSTGSVGVQAVRQCRQYRQAAAHLHHAVQVWHGEGLVALVLPNHLLVPRNLLQRRGQNTERLSTGGQDAPYIPTPLASSEATPLLVAALPTVHTPVAHSPGFATPTHQLTW